LSSADASGLAGARVARNGSSTARRTGLLTPAVVQLKPGRERSLQQRHPWVFSGAIDRVHGEPTTGATVAVVGATGTFLAYGAYSPASQIRARVWSFDAAQTIDAAFFATAIDRACAAREAMLDDAHTACRLV